MKIAESKLKILVVLLAASAISGCSRHSEQVGIVSTTSEPPASSSPNAAILDEVGRAGAWIHAKKVRPIRARKLEQDELIQTLEGPIEAKAGSYLCRGEAGEPWPQSAKSLHDRYLKTDEIDKEGWQKFMPRPDADGVLASKVNHQFTVQSTWGLLTGKAGDYLLKKFSDRDSQYPEDVWIVDATLFQATYAAVDISPEPTLSDRE